MTSGHLGRRTTAALALSALVAAGLVAAPAQAADDLVVTTTDDSGAGSLREALQLASASPGDDLITFDPSVRGTIQLTSGQLVASVGGESGTVLVDGPGAELLTIDAQSSSRVVDVRGSADGAPSTLALRGLTLTGGRPVAGPHPDDLDGGALRAKDAGVVLRGVAVAGNRDAGDGWSPASGGGVSVASSAGATASLQLVDSTVTDNVASGSGGGIHASAGVPVTLTRSVVRDNTAWSVGRGSEAAFEHGEGGGIAADHVTLVASTVAENRALLAGGGLDVHGVELEGSTVSGNEARQGGGLRVSGTVSTITSSTLSENRARSGGAVALTDPSSSLTLTLSTVVDNAAMSGGGVASGGDLQLRGSVVGMNTGGDLVGGGSADVERSLVQEPRDVEVSGTDGPVIGVDPALIPLADAGGATATMVPAPNSPVVDAGGSYGIATDQRGSTRPVDDPATPDATDGADMGAVELTTGELTGPPRLTSLERPVISGVARVGEVLRTDGGTWSSGTVDLAFQWLRDGVPIEGATRRTYRVSTADRGTDRYGEDGRKVLSVRVTAQRTGFLTAVAETDSTGFVGRGRYFTMDGRPKVEGSTEIGTTLRARPRVGAVSPRPETVEISWIVGGRGYPRKQDDRTFTLTPRMRGEDVRVLFAYRSGPDVLYRSVTKPRPVH